MGRQRDHQQPTTTMKRVIVMAASLALVWSAPQFLTDTIKSNCRSEVTTVFEETETETVNKVICQTEFREECNAKVSDVCRNVTTGEVECQNIEKFECVDSITNKCGIEMTRFQEEFVDEDRCRDIPIKDCKNVQSEVCN